MASYLITKAPNGIDDMTGGWTNKDNIKVSDHLYAVANSPTKYAHRTLELYDFKFNIPATATIKGIVYSVKWKTSSKTSACYLYGEIYKNKVIVGTEMWDATAPLTDTVKIKANGALGLTPAILNSADKNVFKIWLQVQHGSSSNPFTAYIDSVTATITYEDEGSIPVPPNLILSGAQVDDFIKLTWV